MYSLYVTWPSKSGLLITDYIGDYPTEADALDMLKFLRVMSDNQIKFYQITPCVYDLPF